MAGAAGGGTAIETTLPTALGLSHNALGFAATCRAGGGSLLSGDHRPSIASLF